MKRFVFCILCLALLFNLVSCVGVGEKVEKEKLVAVEYSSANENASQDYVSQGFTKVTYNSSSDVVLAVENGKADYGVLDDFELHSYIFAGRKIQEVEVCGYAVEYCVYFGGENQTLQEEFNEAIHNLEEDDTLDKIKNAYLKGEPFYESELQKSKEKLVMLCDPSFPNRIYVNDKKVVVGLDVDVARAICDSLGYGLEIVTADFDDLFTMLQDGEGDFLISASQLTEKRTEQFLSSDTYFTLNYHLIEKE